MIGAGQLIDRAWGKATPLGCLPRRDTRLLTNNVFPVLRSLIKARYFSLNVEGAHHVPRSGAVIYVGNHAGWFTLDTLLGALALADHVGVDRLPWGAVQDQLLQTPTIGRFFEGIGGFPASWLKTPLSLPREMEVFSIYPEGTEGNCKSFMHAYQMRPWHSSFVRVAAALNATIVPVAIVGGEECLPVLSTIRWVKPHLGTILPLPMSLVPLPTSWKFIFHEPIRVGRGDLASPNGSAESRERVREFASEVRERVQRTIDEQTADRPFVRFSKAVSAQLTSARSRIEAARTPREAIPTSPSSAELPLLSSGLFFRTPTPEKQRKRRFMALSTPRLST